MGDLVMLLTGFFLLLAAVCQAFSLFFAVLVGATIVGSATVGRDESHGVNCLAAISVILSGLSAASLAMGAW